MYFLDNAGFFSLVSLIVQCGLAWISAAFFWAMAPDRAPWVREWRAAFLGLGIALLAVVVRFLEAHYHIAGDAVVEEGEPVARLLYAVYLAGKVAFYWFLLGGAFALRRLPWRRGHVWWTLLAIAFAAGYALPTVESVLLFQAPWAVAALAGTAALLLRDSPKGGEGLGRRVAGRVLAVWSLLWLIYGVAVLVVGPLRPQLDQAWGQVLKFNTLIDLGMQAVLATGLLVLVMQRAQDELLETVRERDRLREQVEIGERLRALSTVVGGVAHEINNPLTAILGFAGDLADASPSVRDNAARVVTEQAERCRAIVQRLSLLGRRRAPRPMTAGIDPLDLVHRVARGMQRQFDAARIELVLDLDVAERTLYAEAAGLEQILTNLLSNALHASPRGGIVTLRSHGDADWARFVVADRGPGVPAEQRRRVFEPFWSTKQEANGTGIGLAVALALAESHGGTIAIDDAPGGGARFTVTLPWGKPAAAVAPEPATVAADVRDLPRALRLLIVDDEPLIRRTIARYVGMQGWAVVEAASGEQALELLLGEGASFDAVVCDLRMPGMSGAGFYERLERCAPRLLNRLLFVTGDLCSPEAAAFAARCRAPIIAKPFVVSELFGRLKQMVRSA